MRYDANLVTEVLAYLDQPLAVRRSAAGLQTLATLWARIQQEPAGTCPQCQYSDYRRDVAAYVREFSQLPSSPDAMSDTTRKYQIAPAFAGHTFVHEDYGKVVTADNYDDEDAEFFRSKGRTDAFLVAGSAEAAAAAGDPTEVESDNPLVPQADLEAEQAAHDATAEELTQERAAHDTTRQALASEKQAHQHTQTQLTEAQRQLAEVKKQLEKANRKLAAKPEVTKPTEQASDGQGSTEASGTDASGTNAASTENAS